MTRCRITTEFTEKEYKILKQISKEFGLPLSKLTRMAVLDEYFDDWNDPDKIKLAANIKRNIKDLLNYFLFNEDPGQQTIDDFLKN